MFHPSTSGTLSPFPPATGRSPSCFPQTTGALRQALMHACACIVVRESELVLPVVLLYFTTREHCRLSLLTSSPGTVMLFCSVATVCSNFNDPKTVRPFFLRSCNNPFSTFLIYPSYPLPTPPSPSELLPLPVLCCPLCQPSIREGYEGSALLRGLSPRWILNLQRQTLMVKGEPARSQMNPLQAGRHTDWLSLKKHHLCVPTGGGCN